MTNATSRVDFEEVAQDILVTLNNYDLIPSGFNVIFRMTSHDFDSFQFLVKTESYLQNANGFFIHGRNDTIPWDFQILRTQ